MLPLARPRPSMLTCIYGYFSSHSVVCDGIFKDLYTIRSVKRIVGSSRKSVITITPLGL